MATSFTTLKQMVANRLGKTDNATANTLRDNAIIDADKEVCQEHKWTWLRKTGNLTLSSGNANLPSDFNPTFGINIAYIAQTGSDNDHIFQKVDRKDWDEYSTSDYIYDVYWDETNDVYVFATNQTSDSSSTVVIWYQHVPADVSASQSSLCPDPTVVRDLAVALWWLAAERDETNHDRWYQTHYRPKLAKLIAKDQANNRGYMRRQSLFDNLSATESILSTRR